MIFWGEGGKTREEDNFLEFVLIFTKFCLSLHRLQSASLGGAVLCGMAEIKPIEPETGNAGAGKVVP